MSISLIEGNIFDSNCAALVNPVNSIGVSGAGLARKFAERFPYQTERYEAACRLGNVSPGELFIPLGQDTPPMVIYFPTKDHWKYPSKIEYIALGLVNLRKLVLGMSIFSIAIPALGCGYGGLSWTIVHPLMHSMLNDLDDVRIEIYQPQ